MNEFMDKFNEFGAQGWELIGVFDSVVWFKRKIKGD